VLKRVVLALALLWLTAGSGDAFSVHAASAPRYPFPRHVSSAPGTIRPSHRSQTQQDNDVRAFYDNWKAAYLVAAGTTGGGYPLYRISFGTTDPSKTVSEGQGFGMIIIAIMAGYDPGAREIFDGLWEFSRAHPSRSDSRLMAWTVPEPPGGTDSAFDGDADIAYGLLLADKQWGSGGRIDYAAAATEVLVGILESTIGPGSRLPMLGDWVQASGAVYNQYTSRSSDFMTGRPRGLLPGQRHSALPSRDDRQLLGPDDNRRAGLLRRRLTARASTLPAPYPSPVRRPLYRHDQLHRGDQQDQDQDLPDSRGR